MGRVSALLLTCWALWGRTCHFRPGCGTLIRHPLLSPLLPVQCFTASGDSPGTLGNFIRARCALGQVTEEDQSPCSLWGERPVSGTDREPRARGPNSFPKEVTSEARTGRGKGRPGEVPGESQVAGRGSRLRKPAVFRNWEEVQSRLQPSEQGK